MTNFTYLTDDISSTFGARQLSHLFQPTYWATRSWIFSTQQLMKYLQNKHKKCNITTVIYHHQLSWMVSLLAADTRPPIQPSDANHTLNIPSTYCNQMISRTLREMEVLFNLLFARVHNYAPKPCPPYIFHPLPHTLAYCLYTNPWFTHRKNAGGHL